MRSNGLIFFLNSFGCHHPLCKDNLLKEKKSFFLLDSLLDTDVILLFYLLPQHLGNFDINHIIYTKCYNFQFYFFQQTVFLKKKYISFLEYLRMFFFYIKKSNFIFFLLKCVKLLCYYINEMYSSNLENIMNVSNHVCFCVSPFHSTLTSLSLMTY